MKKAIHNTSIAARFKELRTVHLKMSSIDLAEAMGISQSRISKIENGNLSIPNSLIKILVTKYNLNRDWLLDKVGQPIDKVGKTNSLAKAMSLQDTVDGLKTEVIILTKNLNQLYKIVETQGKLIEELEKR